MIQEDFKAYLKMMGAYAEGLGFTITEMQLRLYFKTLQRFSIEQIAEAWETLAVKMEFKTLPLPKMFIDVIESKPEVKTYNSLQITDPKEYMDVDSIKAGMEVLYNTVFNRKN